MKEIALTLLKFKKGKRDYLAQKSEGIFKREWICDYEMDEFGQYFTKPVTPDESKQVSVDLMEIELEIACLEAYINGQDKT